MSETTQPPPPRWTPVTPGPAAAPTPPAPPAPAAPPAPPKLPFHQRVVRIWWAIGVALACLVVGAGAGSLVTHLTEGHGSARFQQFPDGFGRNGFGQRFRGPNGLPGQGWQFQGQQQGQQQGQPQGQQELPGTPGQNAVPPGNGA